MIFGADAFGRRTFGELTGVAQIAVPPATETGTAGSLRGADASTLTGVAATGTAGSIVASPAISLTGVHGTGITGDATGLVGVSGTGVAQSIAASVADILQGVAGIGLAASLSGLAPHFPFYGGFDGLVSARFAPGQITSPRITESDIILTVVAQGVSGEGRVGELRVLTSGGGTSHHHHKRNTGFEPVHKHPQRPTEPVETRIAPPPPQFIRPAPSIIHGYTPPKELVDPALVPPDLLGLQKQIRAAEDISDIQRLLRDFDQDEQDALDVLAILDRTEEMA